MRGFRSFTRLMAFFWMLPVWAKEPRLVSAGGTATEIIYALGAQAGLVAVDSTSHYPAEAQTLTSVGYFRHLSTEGIMALHPTLVIAAAEAGPPAVLEQIERAGVSVLPLVDGFTEDAVLERISQVGAALGKIDEAEKLKELVRRDLNVARATIGQWSDRPRVLFLLSASRGLVAAGSGTAAETIITLAGGENALSGHTGYKSVTAEAVLMAAPEIILTATHVIEALGGVEALRVHPDLANVPAARDGRIIVRDSMFLLGFGPRLGAAALDLAQSLRSGAPLPTLAVSP